VAHPATFPSPAPTAYPPPATTPQRAPKKRRRLPAIIAAVVVVAALGIGGFFAIQALFGSSPLPDGQTQANASDGITWGKYRTRVLDLAFVAEGAEIRKFANLDGTVIKLQLEHISGGDPEKGFEMKDIRTYIEENGPVIIGPGGQTYTWSSTFSTTGENATEDSSGTTVNATIFSIYFELPDGADIKDYNLVFGESFVPLSLLPASEET
jgi:hypothetical protein